jgi:hypothetical protein
MSLSPFRRIRIVGAKLDFALAALAGLLLLTSCISDGPNQTGGDYLAANGIILRNPLYHVTLTGFPVDTFWTTDLEPSHLGDSVMLAGARGRFSADARLAFDFVDTIFIDSLRKDSGSLKLGLGFYRWGIGLDSLKQTVAGDSAGDSMAFAVESWGLSDNGWASRADTLARFGLRFMQRRDTTALLPPVTAVDTIKIALDSAYGKDSLQAFALPHLRAALVANPSAKWAVYMQLRPLAPGALLRLAGNVGGIFEPSLFFGSPRLNAINATLDHERLYPAIVNNLVGVTSKLRYSGPDQFLLTGKNRGMHLLLSRKTFLDSINAHLPQEARDPGTGKFDISFFVPFAKMTLPIDSVKYDGGAFPLDFNLISDIDSVLPGFPQGALPRRTVPLGGQSTLFFAYDSYDYSKVTDSTSISFQRNMHDTTMRDIIIRSYRDTANKDTVTLAVGQSRELLRSYSLTQSYAYFVEAGDSALNVTFYVDAHGVVEPNDFRDPNTGDRLDSLSARLPHTVKPGQNGLSLRTTRGIQRMLNRGESGSTLFPDFYIQPVATPAMDIGSNRRLTYPVMAEIAPTLTAGKPTVNLDLYLFPVKER